MSKARYLRATAGLTTDSTRSRGSILGQPKAGQLIPSTSPLSIFVVAYLHPQFTVPASLILQIIPLFPAEEAEAVAAFAALGTLDNFFVAYAALK